MTHPHAERITHLMGHIMKLYRHKVDGLIHDYEVYPGQPPLLLRLAEQDGRSQRELAERIRIKPATLTVMLDRMAKTGLVERRPDPNDQRVSRVFLTEKGRQAASVVQEAMLAVETQCFEGFLPEEKLLLRRLLLHMQENLQKLDD